MQKYFYLLSFHTNKDRRTDSAGTKVKTHHIAPAQIILLIFVSVILIDSLFLMLPGIDGINGIKKIRTCSNIPILVIRTKKEDADKIDALDTGADDSLIKSCSVEKV